MSWNAIQDKQPEKFQDSNWVKVGIPIASLLVAALGLTAKDIPPWAFWVLVAILFIFASVVLWLPVTWIFAQLRDQRVMAKSARMFYPDLQNMLSRLERQLADSYTDSLVYELRNYANVRDKKDNFIFHGMQEFVHLSEWVSVLSMKASRRKVSDFLEVAKGTALAVSQFWQMCYSLQNRLAGIGAQDLLDGNEMRKLRAAWNSGRDGPNRFFVDWGIFADKVVAETGRAIGGAHHSPLRLLD